MSARGAPVESKRVIDPFGVVDAALATDGGGVKLSAVDILPDPEEATVEDRDEFSDNDSDFIDSTVELVAVLETEPRGSGGGAGPDSPKVTTLTPIPSSEDAGMTKVVWPSFRFNT